MCGANRLPGEDETTAAISSKHVYLCSNGIVCLDMENEYTTWIWKAFSVHGYLRVGTGKVMGCVPLGPKQRCRWRQVLEL
jgi:hypothetical protein